MFPSAWGIVQSKVEISSPLFPVTRLRVREHPINHQQISFNRKARGDCNLPRLTWRLGTVLPLHPRDVALPVLLYASVPSSVARLLGLSPSLARSYHTHRCRGVKQTQEQKRCPERRFADHQEGSTNQKREVRSENLVDQAVFLRDNGSTAHLIKKQGGTPHKGVLGSCNYGVAIVNTKSMAHERKTVSSDDCNCTRAAPHRQPHRA